MVVFDMRSSVPLNAARHRVIAMTCSLVTIVIAGMGLAAYIPGLAVLGRIRPSYIPMAPSTAICFLVLGLIVLLAAHKPLAHGWRTSLAALALMVTIFGGLDVIGDFTGMDLNFEESLAPTLGHLQGVPIGRMSPATGSLFFFAGVAVLLVSLCSDPKEAALRYRKLSFYLGLLVTGAALAFCIAYIAGSPLLYGKGDTIPMAITTAIGFMFLGFALTSKSLFDVLSMLDWIKQRLAKLSMRTRFVVLVLIMVVVCGIVVVLLSTMLYRHELLEARNGLRVSVQAQARLIEAMARHNRSIAVKLRADDPAYDPDRALLQAIASSHGQYASFGETGEFVIARRDGANMSFIVRHRHSEDLKPPPIPFVSDLARPMSKAIAGESGTCIALDYRGVMVVAAYEPVALLECGIVSKIDLSEIRRPHLRVAMTAGSFALVIILVGAFLFFWISNPLIETLENQKHDLLEQIRERESAEAESAKMQNQLFQIQKMDSVGLLAGGIAHDFNNMLGVILGYTELTIDACDSPEMIADLEHVKDAALRSSALTKQLLGFARKQVVSLEVLDVNEVLGKMLGMLRRLIGEQIDLVWRPGLNVWDVKMDHSQIDQILTNLCVNARDAIEGVGRITVEVMNTALDKEYSLDHEDFITGEFVCLSVSDDGAGMDSEVVARIFEPFFTTKGFNKGTGLGLATVYGIVKQNNGFINVYSEPGEGTSFRVYLPRYRGKHAEEQVVAPPSSLKTEETVLLVEDNKSLLRSAARMLERLGYHVLKADSPSNALLWVNDHDLRIDLLLSDVVLPEMTGKALALKIHAIRPDIKHLFMSGYTQNAISHKGILEAGVNFIPKPFCADDIALKIREVLDE